MKKRFKKVFILFILGVSVALIKYKAFQASTNLIIVDPGHGAHDPGTVGLGRIQEKDVNLQIALKLASQLKSQGYDVIMTRDKDEYIDNSSRAKLANKKRAALFISIHANAMENDNWTKGIQVLYYPDSKNKNRDLAQHMLTSLLKGTGAQDKGVVERKDLIVLNQTKMPALLIECGFLTNESEEQLLNTRDYQDKIVASIIASIASLEEYIFEN